MEDPRLILETLKKIKIDFEELKKNKTEDIRKTLGTKYPKMADNYPAIFELVFKKEKFWKNDISQFENMVKMASRVKDSELSQHDASVKIGGHLVDQFVKPQLDGK